MSIQIEASYSKKLGLPNFSSHSFMVTVRAEVTSLRRLEAESGRLYRLLQDSVDKQVEQVGFLPDATKYGLLPSEPPVIHDATSNHARVAAGASSSASSEKQRALIEKLAKEQKFTAEDLDGIAERLFQLPLSRLNRKQTSEFISELLTLAGPPRRNGAQRPAVSVESR